MADEPNVGDMAGGAPRPQPLNYAQPEESRVGGKVFAAIAGTVCSIVVVGFFAALFFPYPLFEAPRPQSIKPLWWAVTVFLGVAAGGIVGTALLWLRRPLDRLGWFFLGTLIGFGLVGLLEGACYANP